MVIRNSIRLGDSSRLLKPPYSYEAVATALEWMASELRATKEDVIVLPKLNVRSEDDRGDVVGLGICVGVERGSNYEHRLKTVYGK